MPGLEKALVNAIVESYLQGVPTRRVQEIVSHLGIDQLSPASVSRMAKDLDDQVQAFLLRPIEPVIPYLFVDASYYKIRDGTRYVTKAVLVVAGVREDSYRKILGARVTDCENEEFWSGMFEDLQERGLTVVQLVIPDGHTGHPEGGFSRLPRCILADVSGSLYPGRLEEYSSETPEGGFRVPEGGLRE